ncbi:MAG: hypothetical protein WED04_12470 [Promethearchaeati archaeon SRVP18_Atabeyarchaeia-1]
MNSRIALEGVEIWIEEIAPNMNADGMMTKHSNFFRPERNPDRLDSIVRVAKTDSRSKVRAARKIGLSPDANERILATI